MPTILSPRSSRLRAPTEPAAAPVGATPARAPRPAALLVLVYLLATVPAFLVHGQGAGSWRWLLAHVAALALLAWALRRRDASALADWAPLLLIPLLYAELPRLMVGAPSPVYHDPVVQRWEGLVFGGQPAHALAGALPWGWLSELLHLGYLSYYAIIFAPPLLLWLRGRRDAPARDAFALTALAVMGAFVACYVAFIFFPVEGPRYAWAPPPGIPDAPVRRLVLAILGSGSARGTAFPSSHAAVSTAATVAALRFQPRVGAAVLALTVLLVVGAVYGGFHYAIDMIVGALLGLAVALPVVLRDRAPTL